MEPKTEMNEEVMSTLFKLPKLVFQYFDQQSGQYIDNWKLHLSGLSLKKNYFYSVLGPNMSGKSTLARLVIGNVPDEFKYKTVYDKKIYDMPKQRHALIENGVVACHQNDPMFQDLSIWENVLLGSPSQPTKVDEERARTICEQSLGLLQDIADIDLRRPLRSLSGGGLALVRLIRAVSWGWKILLLDEATANLDRKNKSLFFECLSKSISKNCIVLLISHDKEDHISLSDIASKNSYKRQDITIHVRNNESWVN